jgi:hypothetical protein
MTVRRSLAQAIVIAIFAAVLVACVGATPYQPAQPRGFGYTEERLDKNKYRVTFRGNSITPRETVEDYLLYRAAELGAIRRRRPPIVIGSIPMAGAGGSITAFRVGTAILGTGGSAVPMTFSR